MAMYDVSGSNEVIGQACNGVSLAEQAARGVAKDQGEAIITASHWPDGWRIVVTREEVNQSAGEPFIRLAIEELDHKAENQDADC